MLRIPVDEAVVEEATGKLNGVLDVYEAMLAKNKYLGGDKLSLADLHHLPNIRYILMTPKASLFTSHPHVSTWWSDISSHPAWTKAAALSDGAILKQAQTAMKGMQISQFASFLFVFVLLWNASSDL
ncbi:glutathione S-transferase-like [Amborella trichopoda]|uniref:glutathione transferase n=1 Tax=Amborella trichopoda TaxID=13333 RepID=U5D3K1_AMBTC|nr:glutathione S-transferase-like [Amborella trichopoda]ERN16999.1 hypothetical protein AMTR_s00057p00211970 [Amborella trichopoda]|eukprot:XP_020529875.1 glutathione S-transferase-like [Amborella trichopoda]